MGKETDDAKNMLGKIATTPIVSRAYDPNCKVSLVGGIIRQMKTFNDRGDREDIPALAILVGYAECFDKDVITEMIDLGNNFTSEYDDANVITRLVCSMISQKIEDGKVQPNDSRTAFAIRAGLLEFCTSMIARFGRDKNDRLVCWVISILENIYLISFHKKTSKAIGDKRGNLLIESQRLKENQLVVSNTQYEKALHIIQSILDITSTSCYFCNQVTERKDMKKCVACKSVCYCSKECQRKDWQSGGHEQHCEEFLRNVRDTTAKLKGLRRNITMARKRLFLENADSIRLQLAAKELPRSEYIVRFDLFQCPLAVTVMAWTEYFVSCRSKKWFEENIQLDDENIMCIYESPFFSGNSNEPGCPENLIVYTLYPREWLSSEA